MNKPAAFTNALAPRHSVSLPTASMLVSYLGSHQPCWSVGKYLGSMLYFDFGEAVTYPLRRGGTVEKGKFVFSIRNCYWRLHRGRREILNSDCVTSDDQAMLRSLFAGSSIERLYRVGRGKEVGVAFSNGCRLFLDMTNRYDADSGEVVAKFSRAEGLAVNLLEDGKLKIGIEHSHFPQPKTDLPQSGPTSKTDR